MTFCTLFLVQSDIRHNLGIILLMSLTFFKIIVLTTFAIKERKENDTWVAMITFILSNLYLPIHFEGFEETYSDLHYRPKMNKQFLLVWILSGMENIFDK